jgi:hypothetical protein
LSWYTVLIITPSIGWTSFVFLKRHHHWPTVSEQISDAFALVCVSNPERKWDRWIEFSVWIFSTIDGSERLSVDLKRCDDRICLRDLCIWEDSTIMLYLSLSICSTSDHRSNLVWHGREWNEVKSCIICGDVIRVFVISNCYNGWYL